MNWTIFATLTAQIEPPLDATVTTIMGALITYITGPLRIGVILYIAAEMIARAMIPNTEPVSHLMRKLTGAAVILSVATSTAMYGAYVQQLFMTILPTEIGNAITGATGNPAISGQTFDMIWNKAWAAGIAVYSNLAWTAFGLQITVVVYWCVALVSIALGFLIWLIAHILVSLFVAVGPLFCGLWVFPALRGLFERWIGAMISGVVLQVFAVALLSLLTVTENAIIQQIGASMGAGGGMDNQIAQLQMLMGGMLLFFVCGVICTQLPGAAATISQGVHFHAASIGRAVYVQAGRAAQTAIAGAGRATGAAVSGIRSRIAPPAGPSLSAARRPPTGVHP